MPPGGEVVADLALGDDEGPAEGLEQLVQLLVGEPVVQGDEGHLGGGGRKEREGEGQAVGAHEGEHVGAVDQGRARPGAGQQLGRGQRVVPGLERDLVGTPGRRHVREQEEVHVRWPVSRRRAGAWPPSARAPRRWR